MTVHLWLSRLSLIIIRENSFSLREVDQSAVNDEEPLSRLAGELKEERAEQDKEERAIFQTEIVGAVSPLADFKREAEEKEEEKEETVTLPKQKVIFIQKLINNIKENTRRDPANLAHFLADIVGLRHGSIARRTKREFTPKW